VIAFEQAYAAAPLCMYLLLMLLSCCLLLRVPVRLFLQWGELGLFEIHRHIDEKPQ
jgi:hypothetical protein